MWRGPGPTLDAGLLAADREASGEGVVWCLKTRVPMGAAPEGLWFLSMSGELTQGGSRSRTQGS